MTDVDSKESLPQNSADEDLTASARNIDNHFRDVYRRYFDDVVHHVMARGASRADAVDAAQDAFVSAYQRWYQVETPRPYLYMAARNKFFHMVRRNDARSRAVGSPSDLDLDIPDKSESPEATFIAAETIASLLKSLTPAQLTVVKSVVEGFSLAETAAKTGLTDGTVRNQLYRARKALQRRMTEQQ